MSGPIRALEWRADGEFAQRAQTPFGFYTIVHAATEAHVIWRFGYEQYRNAIDIEAAKAAATADYDGRILSAIVTATEAASAAAEPVAWRWREMPTDQWILQPGKPPEWATRLNYQVEPLYAQSRPSETPE